MTKQDNLWAPWRINYILGLDSETKPKVKDNSGTSEDSECFICHNFAHPQDDDENLVLWRTEHSIVILNRYPYNNGHLLIAPTKHISGLDDSNDEELLDMMKLIRESKKALSLAIKPHGFNVGMNFSRCAGAGLPGHMHIHVVPRWNGDTNFMSVCGDTKVISQSLIELLELLKKVSGENDLPCL
ncbi:MAG: HIT domain-containing protein [Sedimentisphaerales bacterium]|nr:HIT domain-containing protein [Sedimentisphaerales bacterium]